MTQQEALAWVAEVFEESAADITPETHSTDLPAWDSLGVLTLMAAMDSDFDVLLSEDDIEGLNTVGDVLEILRKNGKVE